jgi:transcriptional regulator with XRE-family HTH domain
MYLFKNKCIFDLKDPVYFKIKNQLFKRKIMLTTGETVRILMDEREITVTDLVKLTGLKEAAILNVIYNRTSRPEYFNRIAKALDIPIDTILRSKKSFLIDVESYLITTQIVSEVLKELKLIQIPSGVLQEYIESLYRNMSENKNLETNKAYLKGMIEGHIKFGIIKGVQL